MRTAANISNVNVRILQGCYLVKYSLLRYMYALKVCAYLALTYRHLMYKLIDYDVLILPIDYINR